MVSTSNLILVETVVEEDDLGLDLAQTAREGQISRSLLARRT